MRQRCNNPNNAGYSNYGGRGITVCARWDRFETFLEDMGPRPSLLHSLDRIDNDGSYTPENCRWALQKIQGNNQRRNRVLTYEGRSQTIAQWAQERKWREGIIHGRLALGWSVEKTLSEPVNEHAYPRGTTFTLNGRTQPIEDWAAELGLSAESLRHRLRLGWELEHALTIPHRPTGPGRPKYVRPIEAVRDTPEKVVRGEDSPKARLTEAQVRAIRTEAAEGGISLRGLARKHGVTLPTIRNVVNRVSWTHVL